MRNFLKSNKWKLLFSSLIILLPTLFGLIVYDKLPNTITTHWGGDGVADGSTLKPLAILLLPLILLATHWLCLVADTLIEKNHEKNKKAHEVVFWVLPALSLFINGMIYCVALGAEFNYAVFFPLLLGIPMMLIGNYLPKISQNRTMGIKTSLTLRNEENWNKTHRFGGKVWVVCGLVLIFTALLPIKAMLIVGGITLAVMVAAPLIYSYCIYLKHKENGVVYPPLAKTKLGKTGVAVTATLLSVVLLLVGVLMFTGDITYKTEGNALEITASYTNDFTVKYDEIDTVTYRTDVDAGMRQYGYGSPRLSMGTFKNDEFGTYTRYTYTQNKECIVLTKGDKVMVINAKTAEDTKALYEALLAKVAP